MLVRVGEKGKPAFQLRPGETGISIFDTNAVNPELDEREILEVFRSQSILIEFTPNTLESLELRIVVVEGTASLPERLRLAHAEIRAGETKSRSEFKRRLKALEENVD